MASRKFFSGLPDGMMTSTTRGPNRLQTNFYWPDETNAVGAPSRSKLRNRSMSTASVMSQVSADNEESRRRKSKNMQSSIEFYDMVDVTDTESVYSRSTHDPNKHKKLETLKSRIEFYDFVDCKTPPNDDDDVQSVIERPIKHIQNTSNVENNEMIESFNEPYRENSVSGQTQNEEIITEGLKSMSFNNNNNSKNSTTKNGNLNEHHVDTSKKKAPKYVDSYSESDDDDYYHRNPSRVDERRVSNQPQSRYTPSHRTIQSHPRRYRSDYFDFDDDGYDRYYEPSSRRSKYRRPEYVPNELRTSRRRLFSPEYISDEDFPDYDEFESPRRQEFSKRRPPMPQERASRMSSRDRFYDDEVPIRRPQRTRNRYENEIDEPSNEPSPRDEHKEPISTARPPVKPLTRSMSINEAKQRHHTNLKSNIFHNDPEYNVMVEQRKPLSVRDFAATQRVGVGLPDFN